MAKGISRVARCCCSRERLRLAEANVYYCRSRNKNKIQNRVLSYS